MLGLGNGKWGGKWKMRDGIHKNTLPCLQGACSAVRNPRLTCRMKALENNAGNFILSAELGVTRRSPKGNKLGLE